MSKDQKLTDIPFVNALVNTAQQNDANEKQKGFLCMLSGGLDSTALFNILLTNPQYKDFNIYAHHIRLKNRENRTGAELQAVRKIIQHYHKREDVREFDYRESEVDMTSMTAEWSPRFSYDMDVVCFVAAQICCARPDIKYVGIAVPKEDFEQSEDNIATLMRIEYAPKIFDAGLYLYPHPPWPKPSILYPTRNLTKKQLWDSLPSYVRELTWSCRTPVWNGNTPQPCKKCHTCKQLQESGINR